MRLNNLRQNINNRSNVNFNAIVKLQGAHGGIPKNIITDITNAATKIGTDKDIIILDIGQIITSALNRFAPVKIRVNNVAAVIDNKLYSYRITTHNYYSEEDFEKLKEKFLDCFNNLKEQIRIKN